MYHNDPLSSLPVDNVSWKSVWCPGHHQTGPGVIVEGCVTNRSRHVIVDTDGKRTRYTALYVSVRRAHHRRFHSSGVEVEPNFSETEKVLQINCIFISIIHFQILSSITKEQEEEEELHYTWLINMVFLYAFVLSKPVT